jgi:hypothetical protein
VSTPWEDVVAALGRFTSTVLTATGPDGYPVSVRCRPVPAEGGVLRPFLPGWFVAETGPGPASLMAHSHNDELWDLKGFVAKGTLEKAGDELVFRPTTYVLTAGGLRGSVRLLLGSRRAAQRYLDRRDLPRPVIPWDTINQAKHAAPR